MSKRKVFKTNPIRKYIILSLFLVFFVGVGYSVLGSLLNINGDVSVDKYDPTLYGVLKKAAKQGTYAREYTGLHQDSMDASLSTQKIYHWYATDADTATNITENMNNVIFGNQCWKIVRTTDTGGVKLIYNGEVENNQCLSTRGNHVGFNSIGTVSDLNASYYYATDYTYDSSTNTFSLAGDKFLAEWNETTGPTLLNYYTCKSSDANGTCSTLYYMNTYSSATSGDAYLLNSSSDYSTFGEVQYNSSDNCSYFDCVGYMHNKGNRSSNRGLYLTYDYTVDSTNVSNVTNCRAGDSYIWNNNTKNYTIQNSIQISTVEDYSTLVGMYYIPNGNSYTYNYINYIYKYDADKNKVYYYILRNNTPLEDYINTSFTYGSSYINNGDGTYTIKEPNVIMNADMEDNSRVLASKYVCKNAVDNTCNELWDVVSAGMFINYYTTNKQYKGARSFTYENGVYTLGDDSKYSWYAYLKGYRYTCFNESGVCSELSYFLSSRNDRYYSLYLQNGESIDDAVENMLYADDINMKDSTVKKAVDLWFGKYLNNYSDFLEDTIFCNNRTIDDYGAFIPTDTEEKFLYLKDLQKSQDISCENITDKFSVSNDYAKLKYKVGLLTAPELYMLKNGTILKTSNSYWVMTPDMGNNIYIIGADNINVHVGTNGDFVQFGIPGSNYNYYSGNYGVKPSVSIKPGIEINGGDGSETNPYTLKLE